MSNERHPDFFVVRLTIGVVFGLLMGYLLGLEHGESGERRAAIKAGVARWAVNPQTGDKRFEYAAHD